jgi:hypothetical protein
MPTIANRNALLAVGGLVLLSLGFSLGWFFRDSRTVAEQDVVLQAIHNQTAVLHRALGRHIPIELPAEQRAKLDDLESALADPERWPKSVQDAQRLHEDTKQFVKTIPPWADEELLPRLVPVRWGVEALWLLQINGDPKPEQLDAVEDTLQSCHERRPDNADPAIVNRLKERTAAVQQQAAQLRRGETIRKAQQALETKGDLAAALTGVADLPADEDVMLLRSQLRSALLEKRSEEQLGMLRATLSRAKALGEARLQQAGVARVHDAAVGLILDLEVEQPRPVRALGQARQLVRDCELDLQKQAAAQQDELARKVRAYQTWALEQIRLCEREYQYDLALRWAVSELTAFKNPTEERAEVANGWNRRLKDIVGERLEVQLPGQTLTLDQQREIHSKAKALVSGWQKNIDQEIAYFWVREGVVQRLLPINTALLEPPVAQLYQKVFAASWEKLKDHADDQYQVAVETARVKKLGLDDVALPGSK